MLIKIVQSFQKDKYKPEELNSRLLKQNLTFLLMQEAKFQICFTRTLIFNQWVPMNRLGPGSLSLDSQASHTGIYSLIWSLNENLLGEVNANELEGQWL